ncbi:MAG: hypothetical protein ACTS73_01400 [Arsenophonus sp. NEOnobi-MAG3]
MEKQYAYQVIDSWANPESFLGRLALEKKLTVTIFKVAGKTNTDNLSALPDA